MISYARIFSGSYENISFMIITVKKSSRSGSNKFKHIALKMHKRSVLQMIGSCLFHSTIQ